MGSSDKQARRDIKAGRDRALGELEKIFSGPLEGLRLAPEFFRLLASPELAGTPLGRGVDLQQAIIDQALGGLTGQGGAAAGQLPGDIRSALLESTGGAQAGRGTFGSPAGNLALANEFVGASEAIRASRLQQAFAALGGTSAAGSVQPSASQFLDIGRQRALAAADVFTGAGSQLAQASLAAEQQKAGALGSILGIGLGAATGGLLGGLGAGGIFGTAGGLGAAGRGAAIGSGLVPSSLFSGGGLLVEKERERGFADFFSRFLSSGRASFTDLLSK
jgi:hypothetical protein